MGSVFPCSTIANVYDGSRLKVEIPVRHKTSANVTDVNG
jgi:hypothetical protein